MERRGREISGKDAALGREKVKDMVSAMSGRASAKVLEAGCTVLLCVAFLLGAASVSFSARAGASAAIVMDARTGKVLQARNADVAAFPASLTKMMTLYLLFDALDQQKVTPATPMKVSSYAARQIPSRLGLAAGSVVTVEQAVRAMIVKSANDAAVVVAEHLSGSEKAFARAMTAKARALGMTRTTFRNASGLPHSEQTTTARDMAILARALRLKHSKQYPLFASRSFCFGETCFDTHNRFIVDYPGAEGLKTGYTKASGYNLAASATHRGTTLIGIVLGGESAEQRDRDMALLMDEGFLRAGLTAPSAVVAENGAGKEGRQARTEADVGRVPAWGVQVGAFKASENAEAAAKQALTALAAAGKRGLPDVAPLAADKGTLYRARILELTDERSAREACSFLQKKGVDDCFVLSPPQTNAARNAASLAALEG